MNQLNPRKITGWHVFGVFFLAFGTIIAVNLTLAFQAVATFPGVEVKNSYVASQTFNKDRDAQLALNWDVSATASADRLVLRIVEDGTPVVATIEKAVFGRATTVAQDQTPALVFDGTAYTAPVAAGDGNWNLRIEARALNGTLFKQRIVVGRIK